MQINNMLPAILQLILSTQTEQKSNKPGPLMPQLPGKQPTQKDGDAQARLLRAADNSRSKNLTSSLTKQTSTGQPNINKETPNPQNEYIFLPIPLNSELFPNAKFYKQISAQEDNQQQEGQNRHRLVFGLNAPSLGEIYFLIVQQEDKLSIRCAAAKASTVKTIKEGFTNFSEKLKEMGWGKIHWSCIHVENPGELPGMPASGFIDLKI